MAEEKPRRGFFGRAFVGGFFGCFGVLAAIVVIAIIIGVILAVSLGGDDDAQVVRSGPTATLAEGETPSDDETDVLSLSIGDTAKVGDAEVTVHGFRTSSGGEFLSPDAGNIWIIVDATVSNTGDDAYNISSLLQTATRDSEGREYNVTIGPTDLQGQLDGTIAPDDVLRGETAFELPADATGLQFVFTQAFGTQQARWNLE